MFNWFPTPLLRLLPFIAILLVAALIVVFNGGISVGSGNHVGLLPVVRRILDPSYLPTDFNIELRLYHHRVFALILATLSGAFGEDRAIVLLHVISVLTLSATLYYLCRAIGLSTTQYLLLGLLLAVNALWIGLGFEENNFVGNAEIQPPLLAHAFVLAGTAAIIQKRWIAAAFFAGLVALFHLQIGFIFLLIAAPLFAVQLRHLGAKRVALMGLTYIVPALPAIWNARRLIERGVTNSSYSIEYLQFRMPHHFELSSIGAGLWLLAHVLCIGAAYAFLRKRQNSQSRAAGVFLAMTLVLGLLIGVHVLDYNWLHFMTSLKIQFPRLSPLITVFGALALLTSLATLKLDHSNIVKFAYVLLITIGGVQTWRLVRNQPERFVTRVQKYADQRSGWVEACTWIKANGETGVVFLAPPGRYGFTYLTDRSSVVEFKINPDGGHLLREWTERLTDLCGGTLPKGSGLDNRRPIDRAFASLSNDQLRALGTKYNATFAILPQASKAALPVLHENRDFRVVRVLQ